MQNSPAKVALITGGAKRVGRAVALRLAETGMDIAFTYNASDQDAEETRQKVRALGQACQMLKIDLSSSTASETIYSWFVQHYDRLDVLVNNASYFAATPVGSFNHQAFEYMMAVNARTPLLLMQQFANLLSAHYLTTDPASTGRIINFVDIHVLGEPLKNFVLYNASKAALLEITMTCAVELAPKITVNAVAPGVVAWPDFYTEEQKSTFMSRVPLGRPGHMDEAAEAVHYLACLAHYCTGQVIKIDGGRVLC